MTFTPKSKPEFGGLVARSAIVGFVYEQLTFLSCRAR